MTLPPELAPLFAQRLGRPLRDPARLSEEVEGHRVAAGRAYARDPLIDLDLAHDLADACQALLAMWPTLSDIQRAQVQVACEWFVETDDEDDDFASLTGFDDDALVLNHVVRELGRRDLTVRLDG